MEEERDVVLQSNELVQDLSALLAEYENLEKLLYNPTAESYQTVVANYLSINGKIQYYLSQLAASKEYSLLQQSKYDSLQILNSNYQEKYQTLLLAKHESLSDNEWADGYAEVVGLNMLSYVSTWAGLEGEALGGQLEQYKESRNIFFVASMIVLTILVLFHLFYHRVIMSEFHRCDDAILQNKINKEIFEYAEQMSGLGHAYYNFDSKKLSFSSNLRRLLGISSQMENPSINDYLRQIDPEDRKMVLEKFKTLPVVKHPLEATAQIVTPQGERRKVRMMGVVKHEEQGKIAILVTKDMTPEIDAQDMLSKLNSNLSLQNRLFRHVEEVAAIGYYTHLIESGIEIFSDNLFRMLGFEPKSFQESKEILISHVLEEDREIASFWMDPTSTQDPGQEVKVRILTRQSTVKFISMGREFFYDEKGQIFLVTLKDVSVESEINSSLAVKNEELFKSNAELASFNHITSHDLQEPLRKIQTLISMLYSLPDLSLPEKARDYLSRINRSANRMQLLILDLLKFSSVSRGNWKFKKYNLQDVVDNVLKELTLKINETGAVIHVSPLPEVSIIPTQMQQLFTNLIENALKFTNGKSPQVTIQQEEVTEEDNAYFPHLEVGNLLKISVQDNGIGFDQAHAENIFIIFNRLHDKQAYEGSGIGLAICKKVVENHGGVLYAKGIPGDGAKFTFVIPIQNGTRIQ